MGQKTTVHPFTVISGTDQLDTFAPPIFHDQYEKLIEAEITSPEAFIVRSKTLFFLAIVHEKNNQHWGTGYVLFSSGDQLGFTATDADRTEVVDKCTLVATKLADNCNGLFEKGIIDSTGRFHCREHLKK